MQRLISYYLIFALSLGSTAIAPVYAADTNNLSDAEKANQQFQKTFAAEQQKKEAEQKAEAARAQSQKAAQDAQKKNNKGGSKAAMMLGVGVLAAGAILLAVSQIPSQSHLKPYAYWTLAGGAATMMVGGMMSQTGDKAGNNATNLGNLAYTPNDLTIPGPYAPNSTNTTSGGTPDGLGNSTSITGPGGGPDGNGGDPSFKLTQSDLSSGKLGEIFDRFEKETGISREDFLKGLNSGATPAEMLQGVGKMSPEDLQKAMDAAQGSGANGSFGSADIEKLASETGLGDLYDQAYGNDGADYSGGSRALASVGSGNGSPGGFDFNKLGDGNATGAAHSADFGKDLFSNDVKQELARQGRTDLTVFELVSQRYRRLTPMLFGKEVGFGTIESVQQQNVLDNSILN